MGNDWTEEDMRKAITAFRQGRSMRHAAELFGVPRSCLHRRLQSGSDVPLKKKGGQTTFTSQQEEQLLQRILRLSACGFGLNSDDVRKAAFSFAEKNGIKHKFSNKTQTAGMDWLIDFRKRHPEIILRKATLLTSPENISPAKKKKEEQKRKLQKKTKTLFPVLPLDSDAESEEDLCGVEKKGKDEKCAFCLVRYEDPKSSKLGDWIQCQGAGKEWYHTTCVGAEKKKMFICGRCRK
ncbi:hypothetical protein C0J52_24200 [Blattella germanica]|nr:hypothetical protein C0J52_24200 [Blattella germanica]